jgi:hypothetical protein
MGHEVALESALHNLAVLETQSAFISGNASLGLVTSIYKAAMLTVGGEDGAIRPMLLTVEARYIQEKVKIFEARSTER